MNISIALSVLVILWMTLVLRFIEQGMSGMFGYAEKMKIFDYILIAATIGFTIYFLIATGALSTINITWLPDLPGLQ